MENQENQIIKNIEVMIVAGYTFRDMKRFAQTGRKRTTKKSLSNVRDALIRDGKKIHYYVWGNRIATFNTKTKRLNVSSAGWETPLTKDRLNRVLPKGRIFQKKFIWHYKTNGKVVPFRGSITLNLKK